MIVTTLHEGYITCSELITGSYHSQVISRILAGYPNLTVKEITAFFLGYDQKTTYMNVRYHIGKMLKQGLVLSNSIGAGKTYKYYLPEKQQKYWVSQL